MGRIFSQTPPAPGTLIESAAINSSGVFGGCQIGYNWKATPSILLGLEADVSGTSLTGNARTFNFAGTGPGWNVKDDVFGTVRGRAGWVIGESWLLYGTGGLALVNDNFTRIQLTGNPGTPPVGLVESNSATRVGWAAGGGVEWGFAPNWSAKLEYMYINFGVTSFDFTVPIHLVPSTFTVNEGHLIQNTVKLGLNYRFN